jgi:hypothetical protein
MNALSPISMSDSVFPYVTADMTGLTGTIRRARDWGVRRGTACHLGALTPGEFRETER